MGIKSIKPKLEFPISIKGQKWKIYLYSNKMFYKLYRECIGITFYNHSMRTENYRYICFRGPKVSKDTIAHELMHAYCSYHDFSRNNKDTMEEKVCEITGKSFKRLYKLTNLIYTKLHSKRLKKYAK